MSKNFFIVFLLCFIYPFLLLGQDRNQLWYFGEFSGLDFRNGAPVPMQGSLNTLEGCATVTDLHGNLLFYTDGITVYNSDHQMMRNGDSLMGHPSASQAVAVCPHPGSNSLFFIFTVDAAEEALSNGLRYSLVDLQKERGLGMIVHKNKLLHVPVVEKICLAQHKNNKDYWLISHEWNSDQFRVYHISEQGIDSNAIISSAGYFQGYNYARALGYLKASPDNNKLAMASYISHRAELLHFDNNTGIVGGYATLTFDSNDFPYGIEFNASGNILYVSSTDSRPGRIYQFDLSLVDPELIKASKQLVGVNNNGKVGAMKRGPDGKIYVAQVYNEYVGVISYPDSLGSACKYDYQAVHLNGGKCHYGLPADVSADFFIPEIFAENFCLGDETVFYPDDSLDVDSIEWYFGEEAIILPDQSGSLYGKHSYQSFGNFTCMAVLYHFDETDTIFKDIYIRDIPYVYLGEDQPLCYGDEIYLDLSLWDLQNFTWHDGSNDPAYFVDGPQTVWVKADDGNCMASDTIHFQECDHLYVPNAFSPNGDGINDCFRLKGSGIADFQLLIYNRYGEMVFKGMDLNSCWNGDYKTAPAPVGVYYYLLAYYTDYGIQRKDQGSFMLIR